MLHRGFLSCGRLGGSAAIKIIAAAAGDQCEVISSNLTADRCGRNAISVVVQPVGLADTYLDDVASTRDGTSFGHVVVAPDGSVWVADWADINDTAP